jgi:hypothetical protein
LARQAWCSRYAFANFFLDGENFMVRFLLAAAVAAATLFAAASPADAAFRLRVESGTTAGPGVVITDNGTGDLNSSVGAIVYSGAISQFTLNVTTGVTTPYLIAPGFYDAMDLSNVTINSSGAGTLRLILENDGYNNAPNGQVLLQSDVGGTLTAPGGSNVTFATYAANGSATPDLGSDVYPAGSLATVTGIGAGGASTVTQTFGSGPFSGSDGVTFNNTGLYSLYTVVTVNFTGAGMVSFDQTFGTAPAPAGVVLLLSGLPVLGVGAWVRRRKAQVPA